jgi:predicted dehydrogenase
MTDIISRRKFVASSAISFSGLAVLGLPALGKAPSKADKLRIGIIGTGNRGAGIASLIKEMAGLELCACCDLIPEHLQNGMQLAAKGARAYTDYRQLLDDKHVEAVIIATPLYLHYPMAVASLDAGKHVYLEKSMTYAISQSLDLVKKVRSSDRIFQVGYQNRYYAMYHKVKEVVRSNWIGRVTHFECQYNRNSNWRVPVKDPGMERVLNWRMYREYCGGLLSELCSHEIDMVNFLLDSHPLKVMGMGGINYWKDGRDTYDHIRAIYEYPNGIQASFTSVLSNAYNGYNMRILGDKGTIEMQREKAFIYAESLENTRGIVDGVTGATREAITQGKPVELVFSQPGEQLLEPTTYALQDFLDCIRNRRKPLSNVESGRDASVAILLGNQSADTQTFQFWKPEYSI